MPIIHFIKTDGEIISTDATIGLSVMEAAISANIEGIDADCGGSCICATCHVHVTPEWVKKVGPAEEAEKELLEFEDNTNAYSRLSCQIRVTEDLDGLKVIIAKR